MRALDAAPVTSRSVDGLPDLERSYALCRDLTRTHSKTFYFASLFLSARKRRAIWAVYSFCRTADDIVDRANPAAERLAEIDHWRQRLLAAYNDAPDHPLMIAFADAARTFDIPMQPALDLLRGASRDVTVRRYESYEELREYCYLVASTVGLLTSPILGYADGALAYGIALGRAMQMTNILRDVGEDGRLGRIYLPAEDLRRFGVSEAQLQAGTVDAKFVALMQFQIARVRTMYDEAAPGIDLLSRGTRFTVRLALSLYCAILSAIERNGYDVFTRRAYVPLHTKVRTALRIACSGLFRRTP